MSTYPHQEQPPCPHCHADGSYREWKELIAYSGPARIKTPAHKIQGSPVMGFVCRRCGYIELFVNPGDFAKE